MQRFQQSTEQAKRLILEAPDNTRKTIFALLTSLVLLCLLLLLSYLGTGTSWTCELDSNEPSHDYICKELRRAANCRNLSGPIRTEILLDINSQVKASAMIVCPWENAISELRICFILTSILTVLLGFFAISKESKRQAELHSSSAYFFCLLLAIASTFDLYSIADAETNNYSLCNLVDEFEVAEGVTGERMNCTFRIYEFTAYIGYLAAASVLFAGYQVNQWKSQISAEGF